MIHLAVGVVSEGHAQDMQGAARYIQDALPGEPLFVIRGRDALAVPVLDAYIQECHRHRLMGQADRAVVHLRRFIDWQRENAKATHLPDPLPTLREKAEAMHAEAKSWGDTHGEGC